MNYRIVECVNPHRWVAYGATYKDRFSIPGFRWSRAFREMFTTNPYLIENLKNEELNQPKEEIVFDIDK